MPNLTKVAVRFNAGPLEEDEDRPSHELASSLYATLATDLPHLEELVLGVSAADPDKLSPSDLLSMAAARSERGRPLQGLVFDLLDFWPNMEVVCPVSPDIDLFREAFAPVSEHVGDVQLLQDAGACGFELRDMWTMREAERYWRIPIRQTPNYRLFWD